MNIQAKFFLGFLALLGLATVVRGEFELTVAVAITVALVWSADTSKAA
jgi:hypothetical protein